ncbi:hypothetical protein ACFVT1_36365 [Streptomyces sp. NPDC057963]|uniref:hypothetical protein n=1 Tax=Streptomyces sp. NPDC057963 TaxID=3346290 RepID=UPI0036EB3D08
MSKTENLLFLGPAIGALITALYALWEGRRQTALQLHTSHLDKRLDIATAFLDAVDAFSASSGKEAETKAARAVAASAMKVRLGFAGRSGVEDAAADAGKWAGVLAQNPEPPPSQVPRLLRELEDLTHNGFVAETARGGLKFVSRIIAELDAAAVKGEDGPDVEQYRDDLYQLENLLEMDLSPVLQPASERRLYQMRAAARREAEVELAAALSRFVEAANDWLLNPSLGRSHRSAKRPGLSRSREVAGEY